MQHGCLTDSPTNPDPETGTRRLDLWAVDASQHGDDACGTAYSARYLSDDEHGCAEIAVYPYAAEDGTFDVAVMTIIGAAVCEDGIWRPDDSAEIDYDYPTAVAFVTLEDAQRVVDEYGQEDQSYALYLRAKPELA